MGDLAPRVGQRVADRLEAAHHPGMAAAPDEQPNRAARPDDRVRCHQGPCSIVAPERDAIRSVAESVSPNAQPRTDAPRRLGCRSPRAVESRGCTCGREPAARAGRRGAVVLRHHVDHHLHAGADALDEVRLADEVASRYRLTRNGLSAPAPRRRRGRRMQEATPTSGSGTSDEGQRSGAIGAGMPRIDHLDDLEYDNPARPDPEGGWSWLPTRPIEDYIAGLDDWRGPTVARAGRPGPRRPRPRRRARSSGRSRCSSRTVRRSGSRPIRAGSRSGSGAGPRWRTIHGLLMGDGDRMRHVTVREGGRSRRRQSATTSAQAMALNAEKGIRPAAPAPEGRAGTQRSGPRVSRPRGSGPASAPPGRPACPCAARSPRAGRARSARGRSSATRGCQKYQPLTGRAREHRVRLGQADPGARLRLEQLEQRALLGVVGAGRVAGRRADALVLLRDQRLVVERLVRRVAPQLAAHAARGGAPRTPRRGGRRAPWRGSPSSRRARP